MINDFLAKSVFSIVLVGDINPTILQPYWLAKKNLIRDSEAKDIVVELIHREFVRFHSDWFELIASGQKIEVRTESAPYYPIIVDLVLGILTFLPETPFRAVGLNSISHYSMPDEERFHELGARYVDLDFWTSSMKTPKLLSLEIKDESRTDNLPGYNRVKISPSDMNIQYGVCIDINSHLDLISSSETLNVKLYLENKWKDFLDYANSINSRI